MTSLAAPAVAQAPVLLRAATLADVPGLETLIAPYVATGDLLPRSNYDLCRHIKEYVVAQAGEEIVACGALKIYSTTLAELAGLAVRDDRQSQGLGRAIVETLVDEARSLRLRTVFALTRKPLFFHRLGFEPVAKERFPQKVWADCTRCPRQQCCDEIAVSRDL